MSTSAKPIVFITGASGMLGQQLMSDLSANYQPLALQRDKSVPHHPTWNYQSTLEQLGIKSPHAVIHLAGAGIADQRWTEDYKQLIRDSRINGTEWLVNEMQSHAKQPQHFLCASAIGFYGHRPGETLSEDSTAGDNFVAELAVQWEAATQKLADTHTRVTNLRFGLMLDRSGGALKNMLLPFKLGLGGRIGSGEQIYSWVSLADVSHAIMFLLDKPMDGPVNITAPNPVSNRVFTTTLAKQLNRPAFIPMPAALARLVFKDLADELLLADAKVMPQKLQQAGFKFQNPTIDQGIQSALCIMY
ncbi:epimerase [Marinicella pacifica]|uniref:Epimerase n=1 Tax=Marinicella pacifica TaxID=1171543 RepID=A0A917FQ79_9GAMM|nr:TIGR01777 family oxidoreductase [Marinicella pacifica]GGF99171.1 epimerase [Marinicella pacifica]